MKLLILTQTVDRNDSNLGFFHRWIDVFSEHVEHVEVLCLQKGEYEFRPNVRVTSLGKERRVGRAMYLWNFYHIVWKRRREYDAVFVHMNHMYVVLGGLLWRWFGKTISLWYAHGTAPVTWSVRLAEMLSHVIFTSTPEGFTLRTKKLRVVGQGIDTDRLSAKSFGGTKKFHIISVGRISRVKGYETVIEVCEMLKSAAVDVEVSLIGGALTSEDQVYYQDLEEIVEKKGLRDIVHFVGAVRPVDVPNYLYHADLLINCSRTGSLDKAVLEAMAVGTLVLTSNPGLISVLERHKNSLTFPQGDAHACMQRVVSLMHMSPEERATLGMSLRHSVQEGHSLDMLIQRMVAILSRHR